MAERPPRLDAWLDGIGLIGPGFPDWAAARAVLRGARPYEPATAVATLPPILPPAERRRTSLAVRIALAAASQAIDDCSHRAQDLASVFTSSGGDGLTCHLICDALAQEDRRVSPTQFHNSVHNAPSGYWGIGARATPASTSLCGHDASFVAGLLEAMTQVAVSDRPVILVAYDTPYPEPLHAVRPVSDAFGLALVLAPEASGNAAGSLGIRLSLTMGQADATIMREQALESLRLSIPTARALPLMQAVAREEAGSVVLDYLEGLDASMPPIRVRVGVAVADDESGRP